ncbi:MurR/RpiR family transcriptional regulator [Nitratireductor pacificus]|uniref:HTH-type transcriptional regulator hexR n=1 Tax=Nitratireductor pacificus pht-3B TaxID=391937 RepID=K2MM32_9HYPH|nr:SIS domain-containing protein [Nitratireductor pacificus]EKF18287.1 HTH-type transcriptional regulator hexR [Nitratireductor pacificus pht-3B]
MTTTDEMEQRQAELDGERFLDLLAARKEELSPSEKRVADFVLEVPDKVIHMSIGTLAEAVGVSQPTVLRFVRTMGLASYPELKLRTGQSIVSGTPYVHSEVASDDPLGQIIDKLLDSSIYALTTLRRSIDQTVLDKAIEVLAKAQRIDCYGTGAARILAMEAQHKLMRFGIPVVTYDDTHLQRLAAATLRPGDVALCFSHTGMVRDTEAMALKARECGATVVSITRPSTALSAASDIVLAIDARENTEIYAPMSSRVAHAVLIDIIATAIALRGGPQLLERLRAAKNSLADLRISSQPSSE